MKPHKRVLLLFFSAILFSSVFSAAQSSSKAAAAAFESGVALRTQKDLQGALKAFSKAIQLDPKYSNA